MRIGLKGCILELLKNVALPSLAGPEPWAGRCDGYKKSTYAVKDGFQILYVVEHVLCFCPNFVNEREVKQ